MSPVLPEELVARRYGGVNGNDITLTEKRTRTNNKVIEFKLRNDSFHRVQFNLLFFCFTLFIGNYTDSLTIVALSAVALAFHCKYITTSIDFDTLLVVESVGIQISSKKIFSGFNSSQFLPWTTVEDVFVNEVITGRIETFEGMPGIHVRGVGEYDRAETLQMMPAVNVPGSYWLSHKQNIYKFTINYHESTRDTKEFLYKDELMKAIRRIIKCQPGQGQLCTVHLKITYKHTFWTRQDKMFAMLKFRTMQRAAVFPQAFILTISILENPDDHIDGVVVKADPNLDCKDSGCIQPLLISPNLAVVDTLNMNISQQTEDDKNSTGDFQLSNSQNDLIDPTTTNIDAVVCQKNLAGIDSNGLLTDSESSESTTNSKSIKRRDTRKNSSELKPTEMYNKDLELGETSTNIIVGDRQQALSQDFFNAPPFTKWDKPSYDHTTDNAEKAEIEGEIGEMGIGSEPITPRSLNITNQVMEGLMFTIGQVEDNVKVVEQKTKMELDEVLENSEKIETKEGERCLVNSSLLRLESLVTKIEIPNKRIKDSKISNTAASIDRLASLSYYSVAGQNSLSDVGRLTVQPVVEEQTNIPVRCAGRSQFNNGSNPNCDNHVKDQVLNKISQSTNESVQIELADVPSVGRKKRSSRENYKILRRGKRGRFLPLDDNVPNLRELPAIDDIKTKNSEGSSTGNDVDNSNNNINDSNNNSSAISNGEVQIDVWKLLQDITRGAKVMVERISDIDIRNATRSSSISVSTIESTSRRILPKRKK